LWLQGDLNPAIPVRHGKNLETNAAARHSTPAGFLNYIAQ
jgi:hypothetical protein